MVIDSMEQKELLLDIIQAAPWNGNYQQLKATVKLLDELLMAVSSADIKQEAVKP